MCCIIQYTGTLMEWVIITAWLLGELSSSKLKRIDAAAKHGVYVFWLASVCHFLIAM